MRTILLTGATGYIGGRLLRRLEAAGHAVRCLARHPERVAATAASTTVIRGDCLDAASLEPAFAGVQAAFYLVHSMGAGTGFSELDRRAAANFAAAAARAGAQRIIYLGGLTDDTAPLSSHLKSRVDTGATLRATGVPVIEFRSSVVIGAGSLVFEMIRALVERLPVMVCPRWVSTPTQPIAIDDVLAYLMAALDLPPGTDRIFDIGGPDVVSYGDMMREYARQRGLRRWLIPVPVLTPRLSGLWLSLVTPTQARIGRAVVESVRNRTVVTSDAARDAFAFTPIPFRQAVAKAIADGDAHLKHDARSIVVNVPPAQAFAPIRCIGGSAGWYSGTVLWQLRGWMDRWLGGVGMNRGRRDPECCEVGDVIDGWTVVAFEPDRRLLLQADLKMPGRGWLEFEVRPLNDGRASEIRQVASFDARGLLGRAYWYAVLPLHAIVFRGLLRGIARRAGAAAPNVFSYWSIVPAPAEDVFRWHERPDALPALLPHTPLLRIDERIGGLRDGGEVTLSVGIGPLRLRWQARHFGFVPDVQFCDEQIRGPFALWRHTHRVQPIGEDRTVYEDRVEYAVPGGRWMNALAAPLVRRLLVRSFATRHRIVRERVLMS